MPATGRYTGASKGERRAGCSVDRERAPQLDAIVHAWAALVFGLDDFLVTYRVAAIAS